MATRENTVLVWMDLETTGIKNPTVLEVGVWFTDLDLMPLTGAPLSWLVDPAIGRITHRGLQDIIEDDTVLDMHTNSGLVQDMIDGPLRSLVDVEKAIIEEIARIRSALPDPENSRFKMAGSGVERFDHNIVETQMPRLAKELYYASTDVSSIRNFLIDTLPGFLPDAVMEHIRTPVPHRVVGDIIFHLQTAGLIRQSLKSLMSEVVP